MSNITLGDVLLAVVCFAVGYGLIGDGLLSRLLFGQWFYLTRRMFGG